MLPGKAKGAVLNCGQAGSHRVEACRKRPLRQPTRNMERLARRRSHGVPGGVRLLVAALVLAARSPAGEMTLHRLMEGAFSRRQPLSMAYSQHLTQDCPMEVGQGMPLPPFSPGEQLASPTEAFNTYLRMRGRDDLNLQGVCGVSGPSSNFSLGYLLCADAAFPECVMRIIGVEGQSVATSLAVRSAGSMPSTTSLRECTIECTGPQLLMSGGALFSDFSDNFTGDSWASLGPLPGCISRHFSCQLRPCGCQGFLALPCWRAAIERCVGSGARPLRSGSVAVFQEARKWRPKASQASVLRLRRSTKPDSKQGAGSSDNAA